MCQAPARLNRMNHELRDFGFVPKKLESYIKHSVFVKKSLLFDKNQDFFTQKDSRVFHSLSASLAGARLQPGWPDF